MSHAAGLFVYGDYSLDKWSPKTKERPVSISLFCVVPLTGLEPVRILLHGILSPGCLPIPPQRREMGTVSLGREGGLKAGAH